MSIFLSTKSCKVASVGGLVMNEIQSFNIYADKSEGDVAILEVVTGRTSNVDIFLYRRIELEGTLKTT